MAALVLLRNPLTPHTREVFPLTPGTPVIDWLQERHPDGFGMPVKFYVNGKERELDDLDYEVGEEDVVAIALMPGDPATLTMIGVNLLISAIMAAVSYFAMRLFAPTAEAGKTKGTVSIYDVSSDQNAARLGEAIPVIYGEVLTTPDYVAQPYSFFSWAQSSFNSFYNGVQYLDLILCLGQGNVDVLDVIVGETDSKTIDAGVIVWNSFKPAQHQSKLGVIASSMGGGFYESVITSPEVSNQEFVQLGDSAGFFATCPAGHKGSRFQIDIVFPGGCFDPQSDGDIAGRNIQFDVHYVELDDGDNAVGSITTSRIICDTRTSATVTGPNLNSTSTSSSSSVNKTAIASPLRRSYMFTAPRSARWAVKITRQTSAPNAKNGTDRFIWAALKLFEDYPVGKAYGDVTLLACRIKASQGLGQDAAVRVKVRAVRMLPPLGGGTEAQTTRGVDAFADVYTNNVYGAGRPETELDITTLTALRAKWDTYQFNHVFRSRTTVWEALRTITTPFAAEPLPSGAVMSVAQDGVKAMRTMLFTDANIVSGSMTINYSFDEDGAPDGIEIEYLDPKDFRQMYAIWPTTALRAEKFSLPGVTSSTHAQEYARLTWQRRQGQRKTVSFSTELEGLLLQIGDRIGISHNVPKWGDGGLVVGGSGNVLIADHDLDWSGTGLKYVLLRRTDGGVTDPIPVSRGAQDHHMAMATANPVNVENGYEYTSFAFGAANMMVRDFIVTSIRPNGDNSVAVEAVNYNTSIYTGAMSFLV